MHARRTAAVAIGAVVALAILASIGLITAASPPRTTAAAGDCTADPSFDSEETAFLMLINGHRMQNGLQPLQASWTLSKAAQWKSQDMGARAYFAHDDGWRTWVQRIRDCGYGYNAWLGENIAAGISSAQAAFDLWRNSAGHNANMLNVNYTAIGIGRAYVAGSPYGWYWTTDFGSVSDGWPSATPTPLPATATPPPPTPTATRTTVAASPTPTRTTAPTATATAAAAVMHVGDLDGSATGNKGRWTGRVTVTVHSASEQPLAGAVVSGRWNGSASVSCTTDSTGRCTVQLSKITGSTSSVSFTVTGVAKSGWTYAPASNHDDDGGSNGTWITVSR